MEGLTINTNKEDILSKVLGFKSRVMLALGLFFTEGTLAQATVPNRRPSQEGQATQPRPTQPRSDRLDLKKLEDQYWSGKETDMLVVQNRTFTKAGRAYVHLGTGTIVNDPYSKGFLPQASLGYYFSERWGFEGFYEAGQLEDNDATEKFKNSFGTPPNYNRLRNYAGASASFVPFYAKMSFLDRSILYFDMSINFGLGMKQYQMIVLDKPELAETVSTPAFHLNFSQHLFFSESWAFRFDLNNSWSNQRRKKARLNSGETEAVRNLRDEVINDTSIKLGLTWFW
jgi:outer membrane beta-barrel protein